MDASVHQLCTNCKCFLHSKGVIIIILDIHFFIYVFYCNIYVLAMCSYYYYYIYCKICIGKISLSMITVVAKLQRGGGYIHVAIKLWRTMLVQYNQVPKVLQPTHVLDKGIIKLWVPTCFFLCKAKLLTLV